MKEKQWFLKVDKDSLPYIQAWREKDFPQREKFNESPLDNYTCITERGWGSHYKDKLASPETDYEITLDWFLKNVLLDHNKETEDLSYLNKLITNLST